MTAPVFLDAAPVRIIERGNERCPHTNTQLIHYNAPLLDCHIWSCPTCHRVVRQDNPSTSEVWTRPRALTPKGLQGELIPGTDQRGWKMPDVRS